MGTDLRRHCFMRLLNKVFVWREIKALSKAGARKSFLHKQRKHNESDCKAVLRVTCVLFSILSKTRKGLGFICPLTLTSLKADIEESEKA